MMRVVFAFSTMAARDKCWWCSPPTQEGTPTILEGEEHTGLGAIRQIKFINMQFNRHLI